MMPTFEMPGEKAQFVAHFERQAEEWPENNSWIVKDPQGAGGNDIYLAEELAQVNMDEGVVVSAYIKNTMLINNFKFDLRFYVLIASLDPLVIYIYDESIMKLTANKYSFDAPIDELKIHLTNVDF